MADAKTASRSLDHLNLMDHRPWERSGFDRKWYRLAPGGREIENAGHKNMLNGIFQEYGQQNTKIAAVPALAEGADQAAKDAHAATLKPLQKAAEELRTDALHKAQDVRLRQGSVGASWHHMTKSLAGRLGFNAEGWAPPKANLTGDKFNVHIKNTLQGNVGAVERMISKPLRIVANRPGLALVGLGAGAIAFGASMFRSNQEKRAIAEQQDTQMALAQSMSSPYMNSVTPYEAALLEERMRAGNGGGMSMGDKVMADRAAAQPVTAGQI